MVGAHRKFKPMYPNFPDQVMEMSEAELYFRAILHYWTQKLPEFDVEERPVLKDKPKFRIIRLGSREDFEGIFTLLAKSKSPFSPQDQEDVKWFVAQYRDGIKRLLPDLIPCKENLGFLGAELIRNTSDAAVVLGDHVKSATDVLRIAVAMSGGDVSLAAPCKFGKFRRPERGLLLGLGCPERRRRVHRRGHSQMSGAEGPLRGDVPEQFHRAALLQLARVFRRVDGPSGPELGRDLRASSRRRSSIR